MVELAEKSANGINSDSGKTAGDAFGTSAADIGTNSFQNAGVDRAALQAEMNQLCAEIDRIALTANFNGNKLLNGNLDGQADSKVVNSIGSDYAEDQKGKALSLQIGETSNKADKLNVSIMRMTTDNLFTAMGEGKAGASYLSADGATKITDKSLLVKNGTSDTEATTVNIMDTVTAEEGSKVSAWANGVTINISDQAMASKAAEGIRIAINDVSMQRAQLGATQNRLDYTINNLDTAKENMEASNSRIRDTDMAKEMMQYTQSNVLTQAAQSMLAQANTQPQNVLQLLQ